MTDDGIMTCFIDFKIRVSSYAYDRCITVNTVVPSSRPSSSLDCWTFCISAITDWATVTLPTSSKGIHTSVKMYNNNAKVTVHQNQRFGHAVNLITETF